jgi:hypothetical protein
VNALEYDYFYLQRSYQDRGSYKCLIMQMNDEGVVWYVHSKVLPAVLYVGECDERGKEEWR